MKKKKKKGRVCNNKILLEGKEGSRKENQEGKKTKKEGKMKKEKKKEGVKICNNKILLEEGEEED